MRLTSPERQQQVIDLFKQGYKIPEIMKIMKMSKATVYRVLNDDGLKYRNSSVRLENIAEQTGYSPVGLTKDEWIKQAKERVRMAGTVKMSMVDAIHYSWRQRRRQA